MLNKDIQITTDRFESLGHLFLHVVVLNGGAAAYRRVINANDAEDVIRLANEVAATAGIGVSEVDQAVTQHVVAAREWWAKKRASSQVGDGYRASFLTSAALEQLDARHRWLIKHVLV